MDNRCRSTEELLHPATSQPVSSQQKHAKQKSRQQSYLQSHTQKMMMQTYDPSTSF
jgi:hypothetical protein